MARIAFSAEHLRTGEPLPFGVYDAKGRRLLQAGAAVASAGQMKVQPAHRRIQALR